MLTIICWLLLVTSSSKWFQSETSHGWTQLWADLQDYFRLERTWIGFSRTLAFRARGSRMTAMADQRKPTGCCLIHNATGYRPKLLQHKSKTKEMWCNKSCLIFFVCKGHPTPCEIWGTKHGDCRAVLWCHNRLLLGVPMMKIWLLGGRFVVGFLLVGVGWVDSLLALWFT